MEKQLGTNERPVQHVTPDAAREMVEHLVEAHQLRTNVFVQALLYLSSSDAVTALPLADVKGKNVMTVAGSNEFAQVFAMGGASSLTVFDRSIPACCMTDLKHAAIRELDFHEWQQTFHSFLRDGPKSVMLDTQHYEKKLRPNVSEATQVFFDAFHSGSLREANALKHVGWQHFVHVRLARSPGTATAISPQGVVNTEEKYAALSDAMRKVPMSIHPTPIEEWKFEENTPDFLYLSNIGFHYWATRGWAKHCRIQGVQEVGFALKAVESKTFKYNGREYYLPKFRDRVMVPGAISHCDDDHMRCIGFDQAAEFGMLMQLDDAADDAPIGGPSDMRRQIRRSIRAGILRTQPGDFPFPYTRKE
jgi:hypothetical protein